MVESIKYKRVGVFKEILKWYYCLYFLNLNLKYLLYLFQIYDKLKL